MGILNSFFKPKPSILTEEDNKKLRDIQRQSYMEEAEKIVRETAKEKARNDLRPKEKRGAF